MSRLKINGFNCGVGGSGADGIGDFLRRTDAAGTPFLAYCVDGTTSLVDAQNIILAGSKVKHNIIFRRASGYDNPGGNTDVPDYNMDPKAAAKKQWDRHVALWPKELREDIVWGETVNELRKEVEWADWIGKFCAETALLALRDGRKWLGPGYSSGTPDEGAWETPGMLRFLELCSEHPDQIGVALHEYSFDRYDIFNEQGYLVGRFRFLIEAARKHGYNDPTIAFTEWGWEERDIPPSVLQSLHDIIDVGAIYAQYPSIIGSAIWTLQPKWGDLDQQVNRLMTPLAELLEQQRYEDVPPSPPPNKDGLPREQYRRTVLVAPENATRKQWAAVCEAAYEAKQTAGFSFDDAGIGALKDKTAVLHDIPQSRKQVFIDWYDEHYPGTKVVFRTLSPLPPDKPLDGLSLGYLFTEQYTLTGAFGVERESGNIHQGSDYDVYEEDGNSAALVLVAFDGEVTDVAKLHGDYGNYAVVRHTFNSKEFYTLYAHLESVYVYPGARLVMGDPVGVVGQSGTDREHLHLMLMYDSVPIDPEQFFLSHPHQVGAVITPPPSPNFPIPQSRNDMPLVIDISKYQGRYTADGKYHADTIDFREMVTVGGVAGFFVRATGGITVDPLYYDWIDQIVLKTNRPFGNFHWLSPYGSGATQAQAFVETRKPGVMGDWLDVEYNKGIGAPSQQQVIDFVNRYTELTGADLGIYTNSTWVSHIRLFDEKWAKMQGWFANWESTPGSLERPWIPKPWSNTDWGVTNEQVLYWQHGTYPIAGYNRGSIDHNVFHGSKKEFDYRFGNAPLPIVPPPPVSNTLIGLHAGADGGDISLAEYGEFRDLKPGVIKVLSSHSERSVSMLSGYHEDAIFIIRAFLSFGGRDVSPEQFVQWTLPDVQRAVNVLDGRDIWVEIHNEPNLVQEGLFSSWAHGAGFGNWLLPVLKMYRAALPSNVKFLFPGLSPGEEISGIRQNSITFAAAAASAINQCDGLAVHGYWATQHGWPMAKTIQQIETAVLPFPSKPVFVTEASNNKASMTPEHKANEYAQFWRELAKIGNVRGVTFFVASASNPDWDWNGGSAETWVGVGMGTKVRSQM